MFRIPRLACLLTAALGCLSSPVATAAGVPYLLKDIDPRPASRVVPVSNLVPFGGANYFWGTSPTTGTELWKTDGTDAGTVLVKDFVLGRNSAILTLGGLLGPYPAEMVVLGGFLYFTAMDTSHGMQLWKTDGTEVGTVRVTDFPGADFLRLGQLLRAGSNLYFISYQEPYRGLWKSDGTAEGTIRLAAGSFDRLDALGSRVIASGGDASQDKVWGSNGTLIGTAVLKSRAPQYMPSSAIAGTNFYFTSKTPGGDELWKTDGTPAGTSRVLYQVDRLIGELDGWLYFTVSGQLCRTQGGFLDVQTVAPLPPAPYVTYACSAGGRLFFTWKDGAGNDALWKTDGTGPGTALIRNVTGFELTAFGDDLLFSGSNQGTDINLWKSDGTPEGTGPVRPPDSGPAPDFLGVMPSNLKLIAGILYFTGTPYPQAGVSDYDPSSALWRSDGTAEGTVPVDIHGGSRSSLVQIPFSSTGDKAYFGVTNAQFSPDLWQSDGSPEGTRPATDEGIPPGTLEIVEMNGARYSVHDGGSFGSSALSRTDNGGGATVLLRYEEWGRIDHPTRVGDLLYFTVQDSITSFYALWKTDGTPAGTVRVKEPEPETAILYSMEPVGAVGDTLFFITQGPAGYRLWKSDGTAEGTVIVKNVQAPPSTYLYISWALPVGDVLLFDINNYDLGTEIWRTDGTETGTTLVRSFMNEPARGSASEPVPVADGAFFLIYDSEQNRVLWKTDGTAGGTVKVSDLGRNTMIGVMRGVGDRLFFAFDGDGAGMELWKSDGTEAGTGRVKDIRPGPNGSIQYSLTEHRGLVFFPANDGVHGEELWRSDGTEAGTFMVADLTGDGGGGYADHLISVGQRLFFLGSTTATGVEPFAYDPSQAPAIAALAPVTITPHGAVLRGTVNAGGIPVTASVEYGTTTGYGTSATIDLVENNLLIPRAFTLPLAGLAPGTTYHYRYTAVNNLGQVQTTDGTFTTQAATPLNLWIEQHDAPGGAGGDKDKDGVKNVLEFAFGTDPADPHTSALAESAGTLVTHGLPIVRGSGGEFRGLFVRRKDRSASGLVYTPQFSADLVEWTDATTPPQIIGGGEVYQLLSYPAPVIPAGPQPRFFRVKVAAP